MDQPVTHVAKVLHQGALRLLLVIHHDFPDYLAEHFFPITNAIPISCTQLRNLVLSALPRGLSEFPDPFVGELQIGNVEDIKTVPVVRGDYLTALKDNGLMETLDRVLANSRIVSNDDVKSIIERLYTTQETDQHVLDNSALNSLVLYVGLKAIDSSAEKNSLPAFNPASSEVELLSRLVVELPIAGRHHMLNAIANHLRFPNVHTYWFHHLIIHMFDYASDHPLEEQVHEQIATVLLERLVVHRPHPWGIIISLTELFKDRYKELWELSAVRQSEEVWFSAPGQLLDNQY